MADRTEALVLSMSADIRKLEKALNQARGMTNRQLGGMEARFEQMNRNIRRSQDGLANDLRRSVAALGVGFAVRELAQAADSWTNLRNQVKQYSDVVGPVGDATDRIAAIATDAGVAIDALATTFAASARAGRTLKASGDAVFQFNEAVAKGAAIANTGVSAVDGALRQLGQAIASPRVQLQEFQSVIEGTPRLAQAFADGVKDAGGSVAKLRQIIGDQSGKGISGAQLFQALISQLPKLRGEFAQTEATVGRSITRLNNAFTQYVGKANSASGVTATLGGFIDEVAKNFDQLADAAIVAASVMGGALAAGAIIRLVAALGTMITAARTATTAMEALKLATIFFTGPTGAAILAIGAALGLMAVNAARGKRGLDGIEEALGRAEAAQAQVRSDTEQLTAANERLQKAIAGQADISEAVARRDVEAIQRRIDANKRLAESEKILARDELEKAQADSEREKLRLAIATQAPRAFPGVSVSGVNFPDVRARIRAVPVGKLTDDQAAVNSLFVQLDIFEARVEAQRLRLQALEDMAKLQDLDAGAAGGLVDLGGGAAGASKLKRFQTDLEKFNETLREIRASTEDSSNKSRAAVQALIDYARAGEDVGAALALIPSLKDVLAEGDWGFLHNALAQVKKDLEDLPTTAAFIFDATQGVSPEDLAPSKDFEDAQKDWREGIRKATKEGLKEGISTDDWGTALRNAVASAVVDGMDEALNRFADMLTDILLGNKATGNLIGTALNAVGSFLGITSSAPISPTAVNGFSGGVKSTSGVSISAPLIVNGSVDAVTMPVLRAAMDTNTKAILSKVPGTVNAVLGDNRRQQRRI